MSAESEDPRRERIDEEAAAWIIRRDRGLSAEDVRELTRRIESDPAFRASVERYDELWRRMDLASALKPSEIDAADPDLLAPGVRRSRWVRPLQAAASLGIAAALAALLWLGVRSHHAEPALRDLTLEDGSKVELNRDAEISVEFTDGERRVRLVRGEAQFFVAKNPQRPFIVEAGKAEVKALGTAFDVAMASSAVDLIVTEGRVRLDPDASLPMTRPETATPLVEAGYRAVVSTHGGGSAPKISAVSPEEMDKILAWQPRLMDYTDAPLSRIVADFNRRNVTQLTIADPKLHDLRISASLRSDSVDGFVRLLEASFGVIAVRRGPTELALTRGP